MEIVDLHEKKQKKNPQHDTLRSCGDDGLIVIFHVGLFCRRLEGKSQGVEDELLRLGEMRIETVEGTRSIALELCREFDDKFIETMSSGEVSAVAVYFCVLVFDCDLEYCSVCHSNRCCMAIGDI